MSDESQPTNLETVMAALITDATERANKGWEAFMKQEGNGLSKFPPTLLTIAKRFFLTGYGLALVDHTKDSLAIMRAAADLDQEENIRKLRPV